MASSIWHRRNSMDTPPSMEEESIRRHESDHLELQECTESLRHLINTFEEDFRRATEASRDEGWMGIAGGVTMIAGLALAPFTIGVSAAVSGVGAVVALRSGIHGGISNFKKMIQRRKISQNIINGLDEFQNKIIPMNDIMKVTCQYTNEILSAINIPEHYFNGLIKCVATVSELLHMIWIYDIGEEAAQMSKTLRLTGTLTGIVAGVGLVLDIFSVTEDNKALEDMDNLAKNGQIRESEIKSKAGKFIVEGRKVIHELENIMDKLKKTKISDPLTEDNRLLKMK